MRGIRELSLTRVVPKDDVVVDVGEVAVASHGSHLLVAYLTTSDTLWPRIKGNPMAPSKALYAGVPVEQVASILNGKGLYASCLKELT